MVEYAPRTGFLTAPYNKSPPDARCVHDRTMSGSPMVRVPIHYDAVGGDGHNRPHHSVIRHKPVRLMHPDTGKEIKLTLRALERRTIK